MQIELERCPEAIREYAGTARCVKCDTTPGTGLAVVVRHSPPMYFVLMTCVKCGGRGQATFIGAAPAPAEAAPAEMPSWYAHVEAEK